MGQRQRLRSVALGACLALLACAESRSPGSALAGPDPDQDAGASAFDASVVEAGRPPPLDAALDAAQLPHADGAVGVADSGSIIPADAEVDARAPLLGEARLEVLTKPSPMSRYEPRNLLAVWVEDEASTPIKVLARWAGVSQRGLTIFNERLPNAFGAPVFPQSDAVAIAKVDPDVITGATLRMHDVHVLTWDLSDYAGAPVPDGTYFIYIETNDGTGDSGLAMLELIKGPAPSTLEQGESERFAYIRLSYTPGDP